MILSYYHFNVRAYFNLEYFSYLITRSIYLCMHLAFDIQQKKLSTICSRSCLNKIYLTILTANRATITVLIRYQNHAQMKS